MKRFGEDVGVHVCGGYAVHVDVAVDDVVLEKVMTDVYILALFGRCMIVCYEHC